VSDTKSYVVAVFITPDAGKPMIQVSSTRAVVGRGLEGDRYYNGTGAYSRSKSGKIRDVSLIAAEAISTAEFECATGFFFAETRRNLVTFGVDLNSLVGREFRVGEVLMRGTELCDPCNRPSKLSGKGGFKEAFASRGGLRAEILNDGDIRQGDAVVVL